MSQRPVKMSKGITVYQQQHAVPSMHTGPQAGGPAPQASAYHTTSVAAPVSTGGDPRVTASLDVPPAEGHADGTAVTADSDTAAEVPAKAAVGAAVPRSKTGMAGVDGVRSPPRQTHVKGGKGKQRKNEKGAAAAVGTAAGGSQEKAPEAAEVQVLAPEEAAEKLLPAHAEHDEGLAASPAPAPAKKVRAGRTTKAAMTHGSDDADADAVTAGDSIHTGNGAALVGTGGATGVASGVAGAEGVRPEHEQAPARIPAAKPPTGPSATAPAAAAGKGKSAYQEAAAGKAKMQRLGLPSGDVGHGLDTLTHGSLDPIEDPDTPAHAKAAAAAAKRRGGMAGGTRSPIRDRKAAAAAIGIAAYGSAADTGLQKPKAAASAGALRAAAGDVHAETKDVDVYSMGLSDEEDTIENSLPMPQAKRSKPDHRGVVSIKQAAKSGKAGAAAAGSQKGAAQAGRKGGSKPLAPLPPDLPRGKAATAAAAAYIAPGSNKPSLAGKKRGAGGLDGGLDDADVAAAGRRPARGAKDKVSVPSNGCQM